MKYQIVINGEKVKCPDWIEPKAAKLPKAPKWLKKCKFYTHRTLSQPIGAFNLTEASTGLAVVKFERNRTSAVNQGLERILKAGYKTFRSAVKTVKARYAPKQKAA